MKDLLQDARIEILSLRRQNELLRAALVKIEAALRNDSRPKAIIGDSVEYRLDGQAMYQAINAAREALRAPETGASK